MILTWACSKVTADLPALVPSSSRLINKVLLGTIEKPCRVSPVGEEVVYLLAQATVTRLVATSKQRLSWIEESK